MKDAVLSLTELALYMTLGLAAVWGAVLVTLLAACRAGGAAARRKGGLWEFHLGKVRVTFAARPRQGFAGKEAFGYSLDVGRRA